MTESGRGRPHDVLVGGIDNPLPHGTRDLLPAACRRRGLSTRSLLDTFASWGFDQVATPSLEYDEVLGRGLSRSERARCVRFIEAATGELVSLRADVTPQIARLVAQRVGGAVDHDEVLRLSYAAEVIRLPGSANRGADERAQQPQVGVEHVGAATEHADAELIVLSHAALVAVGLRGHAFDLSHIGIARQAISAAGLDGHVAAEVRGRLARKDPKGLRRLLDGVDVDPEIGGALISLCELHGPVGILDRARTALAALGVDEALDRLARVIDAVACFDPSLHDQLTVDLGEVRGFDYYSGLRLRVWAHGVSHPVIRGGRYDHLLGRYGAALPATGFAVDLDALEQALEHGGAVDSRAEEPCIHLIAFGPGSQELRRRASVLAREARDSGHRSWVSEEVPLARAKGRAVACGATRLSYVEESAVSIVERVFEWNVSAWVEHRVSGDGAEATGCSGDPGKTGHGS